LEEGGSVMRRRDRGFGCLQLAGAGCLVIVVLAVVLGILLYFKAEDWARAAGAKIVEVAAEEVMDEVGLSDEEKSSAIGPVREFASKIRDGEASAEQIAAVVEEFAEGRAWAALLMRGFLTKYLEPSELSDEEKAAGRVVVGRFTEGLLKESIPRERLEEISNIVTYETVGADGEKERKLKESITTDELKSCLTIMKDAADTGGVESKEFIHDIGEMIGQAIERGMARPSGQDTDDHPARDAGKAGPGPADPGR